jgi:mRNA-degrading endonuclease RelE of RelBE toxin-antitoxin system
LADDPHIGSELISEWDGCRAIHFGNDQYRLIWEIHEEDKVVIILRAAKRFGIGGSVYEQGRPAVDG